ASAGARHRADQTGPGGFLVLGQPRKLNLDPALVVGILDVGDDPDRRPRAAALLAGGTGGELHERPAAPAANREAGLVAGARGADMGRRRDVVRPAQAGTHPLNADPRAGPDARVAGRDAIGAN